MEEKNKRGWDTYGRLTQIRPDRLGKWFTPTRGRKTEFLEGPETAESHLQAKKKSGESFKCDKSGPNSCPSGAVVSWQSRGGELLETQIVPKKKRCARMPTGTQKKKKRLMPEQSGQGRKAVDTGEPGDASCKIPGKDKGRGKTVNASSH